MSKKRDAKGRAVPTVKCLYCAKDLVPSRKGNLGPHLRGGTQCPGVGMPVASVTAVRELRNQEAAKREKP